MMSTEPAQNWVSEAAAPAETPSRRGTKPTIKGLRAVQPPPGSEGFLGLLYREASLPFTWLLVRTSATANQITLLWIAVAMLGMGLMTSGNYWQGLAGAACLQLVELLDRVDGDLARYRNHRTLYGKYMDLLGHALIKLLLIACIGVGVHVSRPQEWVLLLSIAGTMGLSLGSQLHFYRGYLLGKSTIKYEQRSRPKSRARRLVLKTENLWRTGGLFAVVLVGAATNLMTYVLIFYGVTAPLWALTVIIRIFRELRAFDTSPKQFNPEDEGIGAFD